MLELIQSPSRVTREEWLLKATSLLSPYFTAKGYQLPAIRVSTGFTGSRSGYKAIGACWSPEASTDHTHQLFISPVISNSLRVLDVLVHELCHAVVDVTEGHNRVFKACAVAMGLTGKMTATTATPELTAKLQAIVATIGDYPHAMLTPSLSGIKKQKTRMIKLICANNTNYSVRTTQSNIDIGFPRCPCCDETMVLS